MKEKEIHLALEVMEQKIVKEAKKGKDTEELRRLLQEKNEIYKENPEVIKKVLSDYIKQIQ